MRQSATMLKPKQATFLSADINSVAPPAFHVMLKPTDGSHLQSGLRILLLSEQGDALSWLTLSYGQ